MNMGDFFGILLEIFVFTIDHKTHFAQLAT